MPAEARAPRPAVAIPVYKPVLSAAERVSVERTVQTLRGRDLFLVGPQHLAPWMHQQCLRHAPALQCKVYDDRYFAGIAGYNALMRSKVFYRSFAAFSHVLIAQTDALVLSDQLDHWCARDISYVGAPWFAGGSEPVRPLEFVGVGNGGFSLRRVDDFLRVLSTLRRVPNFVKSRSGGRTAVARAWRRLKHEWYYAYSIGPLVPTSNEDVFWGVLVPAAFPFFRVPSPEQALEFAFEVAPREMYALNGFRLPFGCHAWERCDRAFWIEQLPDLGPSLQAAAAG
jgi:hypothetical protein